MAASKGWTVPNSLKPKIETSLIGRLGCGGWTTKMAEKRRFSAKRRRRCPLTSPTSAMTGRSGGSGRPRLHRCRQLCRPGRRHSTQNSSKQQEAVVTKNCCLSINLAKRGPSGPSLPLVPATDVALSFGKSPQATKATSSCARSANLEMEGLCG